MAPKVYLRLRCRGRRCSQQRRRRRRRRRCCKHDAHICIYDLLLASPACLLGLASSAVRLPLASPAAAFPTLSPSQLSPLACLADLVNYAAARSVTWLILRPFLRALLGSRRRSISAAPPLPAPLLACRPPSALSTSFLFFFFALHFSIGRRKLENALNSCGLRLR